MITRPTVLVLGAGASASFGFPLGYGLLRAVCSDPDLGIENSLARRLVEAGFAAEDVKTFCRRLAYSGCQSVDEYLEHNPAFLEVGKAAIAAGLLPFEQPTRLFEKGPAGPHWYDLLFAQMRTEPKRFHFNALTLVTFNYDRSLEFYLHTALQNSYDMSPEEAATILTAIPILHLHGSLGPLHTHGPTAVPYSPQSTPHGIRSSASSIRIIHETDHSDDVFTMARNALGNAARVLFLGFGYHPTNVGRLKVREWAKAAKVEGSALDLTPAQCLAVTQLFDNGITLGSTTHDTHAFLRHAVALDAA